VTAAITGGQKRSLNATEQISAGFAGGALSGIACAPMELVLIQQQRFGGSLFSTPGRIVSSFSGSSLFRGLAMSCGREGIFTAGYLGIGPAMTAYLTNDQGMSPVTAKVAGALTGGVLAGTLSHPMDTIKSCQQGDLEQKTFTSVAQTARTLFADGGVKRFFRGWGWRTSRMIVGIGLITELRHVVAPFLFSHHFEEE
jgi:solute carrier family 25 (mitochondrial carnitine/acylcarnitine transporter), member 20/29